MHRAALGAALVLALALPACERKPLLPGPAEDARFLAEMKMATASARTKLPYFWERKKAYDQAPVVDAPEYDFMLRIALPRRDGVDAREMIWVDAVDNDQGRLSGYVATAPMHLGDLKRTDRITFADRDIVDWAFTTRHGLVGHYTTRVELPRMDLERAANLRASLTENP
jgi:uncharacterized protein YegJ (DUF2314 family)